MFDIEKFYREAEAGERVDEAGLLGFLAEYRNIVIWGAGNLGTALGEKLLEKGVKISAYWDARYEKLGTCNGIPVLKTYSGDFHAEETMVIIGIVNGVKGEKWQTRLLTENGYTHFLYGMRLYEGIGCGMYVGSPLGVANCTGSSICNFNTCKKYLRILEEDIAPRKKDLISIHVLEFIVSHRCTLDCRYCGQMAGLIKREMPQHYRDYPLERVKRDIDICMDNIDVVGTFSIIGGEPFIHPDIIEIVEHCLTKRNVAIISITTNGVCKMSAEDLKRIRNPRVKINFSDYTEALDEKKKELFRENVEKVQSTGINCNVGTPLWSSVTSELRENPNMSPEYLTALKSGCNMGPSVCNGVFYACPTIELYSKTEKFPVDRQYIVLDESADVRGEIRELISRPYYQCCGFRCGNIKESHEIPPGEQYAEENTDE